MADDETDSSDNQLCKYAACTAPAGLKKAGTCSTDRDDCNGSGTASDYYFIDTNDNRKCKLKVKTDCASGTPNIAKDGTCVA